MIIETQISQEKKLVAKRYDSVTAISQDKNMSTTKKVFDCKFRH